MEHTQSTIVARPIVIRRGLARLRTDADEVSLPRPHDPDDRVLVASLGDWELRDFADGSRFAAFFARHGLAHRQLYLRSAPLSILTPSALTGGAFELCASDGRARFRDEPALRAFVARHFEAALPATISLRAAGRWR
ncbi:MAG: hypothetical protein JNK05_03265 [Myxococcales bacterium]|nr:hypothetical protein [Myxococcales bacterium]